MTFKYYLINSGFLKNRLMLYFKMFSPDDINTLLKRISLLVYRWRNMVLVIICWFKGDDCITIMS
jgi:hypothetical protein